MRVHLPRHKRPDLLPLQERRHERLLCQGLFFCVGLYCPTAGVENILNFFYLCYLDYCLSNQLIEHKLFFFYSCILISDLSDLLDPAVWGLLFVVLHA